MDRNLTGQQAEALNPKMPKVGPDTMSADMTAEIESLWKAGRACVLGRFLTVPRAPHEHLVDLYVALDTGDIAAHTWTWVCGVRPSHEAACYFLTTWHLNRCIDDVADHSPL